MPIISPTVGSMATIPELFTVLTSIGLLLSEHNPDDGLMAETLSIYIQTSIDEMCDELR